MFVINKVFKSVFFLCRPLALSINHIELRKYTHIYVHIHIHIHPPILSKLLYIKMLSNMMGIIIRKAKADDNL